MRRTFIAWVVVMLGLSGNIFAEFKDRSISYSPQGPRTKVIYGEDNRKDLYQVRQSRLLELADSTVALFPAGGVLIDPSGGSAQLSTEQFGQSMGLCKEEPFYEQPSGAFCSGFLVGHDLVATAGHCINDAVDCASTKLVFGFSIHKKGDSATRVPAGNVYGCKAIIGRERQGLGADWVVVKLDRPVTNHRPLELDRNGMVQNGDPLVVIGHPSGLPTKVADGAKVRDASPAGYFVANLDTYGGNSGSAVFNLTTGLVEGILVRGEQDFEPRGSCYVSRKCPDSGCRGEDVTKVASILGDVPPGGSVLASLKASKPSAAMLSLISEAGADSPIVSQ